MKRKRKGRTNRTLARTPSARDWGPKFLKRLALCGNIRQAAAYAKIARSCIYLRRDNDPVFAHGLAAALEDADDRLEEQARKRASKSDKVLLFLLQVRRYGKKATIEHKYSGGVTANVSHDLATRLQPYASVIQAFLGGGGALRPDGAVQPVDTAQAAPETGTVPVI